MTTITPVHPSALPARSSQRHSPDGHSVLVRLESVCVHRSGRPILHAQDLDVRLGELTAIAGPSGAGKSTLLRTIAGLVAPTAGSLTEQCVEDPTQPPTRIGYVPQDDIVHLDLSVERVLHHAAALRTDEPALQRRNRIDRVLELLSLDHRRTTRVRSLSGGERKRASIGVELLGDPELLLLDEPTSGLDPASAAGLMDHLRHLARQGTAVVVTSHSAADLRRCDRIVVLTDRGRQRYVGTPDDARRHFGVDDLADMYGALGGESAGTCAACATPPSSGADRPRSVDRVRPAGTSRQWRTLTVRNLELMAGNRLTMAVSAGSPVLVVLMMVSLFPAGTFDAGSPDSMRIQAAYWITFAGFFFGLTYGLLQIATEIPIVRRDRMAGMGLGAYLASKIAALVPALALVTATMLTALSLSGRLPSLDAASWAALSVTVFCVAVAALTTGLLASAVVTDVTQATLALPLICFPQVLFAGALLPRPEMGPVARLVSDALATRWGFESVGRGLGVGDAIEPGADAAAFAPALSGPVTVGWISLATLAAVTVVATMAVLRHRTVDES